LAFHLPYFALRASTQPKYPKLGTQTSPPRQWKDLSFLELQPFGSQNQRNYGIHQAQISVSICGSDDQRWVAYSFVDTHFDDNNLDDEIFSYEGIQDDPIACGKIDANLPIGDPREYFLMIFEIQSNQVRKEWEYLVRMVERGIMQSVRILLPLSLSKIYPQV